MLRDGAEVLTVRARIAENGIRREQRAVLGARTKSFSIDGKKPETLAGYATRTPVVVLHPGDLTLVSGAASGRRTLLDRVALFMDPASADHRLRYTRAARSRKVVLETRGPGAPDLGPLERLMSVHGVELSRARGVAAEALLGALLPLLGRMAAPDVTVTARFEPGGALDGDQFRAELERRREQDLRRGSPGYGPSRDDL